MPSVVLDSHCNFFNQSEVKPEPIGPVQDGSLDQI